MTNDTLRALYVLAADYHSGQWSRGYRIGCQAGRLLNARNETTSVYDSSQWADVRDSPEYAKYQPMAERYF